MLHLMLHDDWEVHGDGSGDAERLMFDPVRRILDLCDQYGAKYTIFAEVGQQFGYQDSPEPRHQRHAETWETIVKDAVGRGHDVQLHLHPQWIGATWNGEQWQLDFSKWATSGLSQEEATEWLERGKTYLESLLQPVDPTYRTVAFRAGGWMMQPSTAALAAMRTVGLEADVTVIKGLVMENAALGSVDFRHAPSALVPWYAALHDVATAADPEETGILCLPTYGETLHIPPILYQIRQHPGAFRYRRGLDKHLAALNYSPRYNETAPESDPTYVRHHRRLRRLFAPRTLIADFGMTHHATLTNMVDRAAANARATGCTQLPLILMSHAKGFYGFDNFERLLQYLARHDAIRFATTRATVAAIRQQGLDAWLHDPSPAPDLA